MKLYTFEIDRRTGLGVEHNGRLVDMAAISPDTASQACFSDMLSFVNGGAAALSAARKALITLDRAAASGSHVASYAFGDVQLRAPILHPGKVLCSGINYHSHLLENPSATLPDSPFFFAKLPNTIIGPGQPIIHPKLTKQLDYEVEFAVVIGRRLHNAPESIIMESLAGYTILHDVSARDVQFKDNQITLGKNFDSFAPIGPCIVTTDELPDVTNIRLRSYVNGQLMQDGSTSDWVFSLPRLISALSAVMTLDPGDIVSTGTPSGVGVFRKPQVFLKPGDLVVLEIEGIGRLENQVIAL